jgi:hypothetical protein
VLLLIANQFFLGLLHLHLQFGQLLGKPVRGACRGLEVGLVILLDVSVNHRIDYLRSQTGSGLEKRISSRRVRGLS